jgi:hypothetical protein
LEIGGEKLDDATAVLLGNAYRRELAALSGVFAVRAFETN